jgi:hypothetical protein
MNLPSGCQAKIMAWIAMLSALSLTACTTQPVRCDGKLEPINPVAQKPIGEGKAR